MKRIPGRPPLDDRDPADRDPSVRVSMRVTAPQFDKMHAEARRDCLTMSEWLRQHLPGFVRQK